MSGPPDSSPEELRNPGEVGFSPRSTPVQTKPSKRLANVYERVIAGERVIRGGKTRP